jgi:CRP-like cAMP-binding protein
MFGFNFFLDNTLSIKHLPPAKHHAVWQRLRQDIYRFFYEKAKLETQVENPNMIKIEPEDFDPYPGEFMKNDLEDKVTKTNLILALDYLTQNKLEDARGAIKNIYISKYDAIPEQNVFQEYLKTQKNWLEVLKFAREEFYDLRQIFIKSKLCPPEVSQKKRNEPKNRKEIKALQLDIFADLSYEEKNALIKISEIKNYQPDEIIIKHGDPDDTIYILLSGRAKITEYNENNSQNDQEVVLAEMDTGDFFGLTSLITKKNNVYRGDVKAFEPLVLLSFPRDKLMDYFHKYHKSSINLLLHFIDKLNEHLNIVSELYAESQLKSQDIQSAITSDEE